MSDTAANPAAAPEINVSYRLAASGDYHEGFQDGFADGYSRGWQECWDIVIKQANAFVNKESSQTEDGGKQK